MELCQYCESKPTLVRENTNIVCNKCGSGLCKNCFEISIGILGTIGDQNEVIRAEHRNTNNMEWPNVGYHPPNTGGYNMLRMCIACLNAKDLVHGRLELDKVKMLNLATN